MEFMPKFARLPKHHGLLKDINSAASRLFSKLEHLDIRSLDISDYNKRYLGNIVRSTLAVRSYILSWAVAPANIPLNHFVLLDYGGGTGILALLAKELGIGTVIYNDIYDVSCEDAKVIGDSIGNQADYYVHGDIDDVIEFLRTNSISCNAIASYDVIEHIYDIYEFLKKLTALSNGFLSVVMSSGANIFNPLNRKSIMKKQIEVENKDRERKWGHKERDCLRSYLKVREGMIIEHAPSLSEEEIRRLARLTRGMIEIDIKQCVDGYLASGQLPSEPDHPTNTCDPYTGNWAERLMDPYHLKDVLSKSGFKVKVLSGYYGRPMNAIKRLLASVLNLTIYCSKKQGIRLAPFYTVYGTRGED